MSSQALGVAALILQVHSALMRTMASMIGIHFMGLSQAAHYCQKQFGMSNKMTKKLRMLDASFNCVRHIDEVITNEFVQDTQRFLKQARTAKDAGGKECAYEEEAGMTDVATRPQVSTSVSQELSPYWQAN